MADALNLSEMLNEHWLAAIGDLVSSQADAAKYLGVNRDTATIPERSLTFTSLNQLPPKDINVVIFGQDPYPRAESAIGVAFNDGAIHNWTDKFSPSFANIIKNLLYCKGMVTIDQGVAEVRKVLARESIAPPPAWFEHTIKNGVCWLNTSLTFTSTDTTILAQHLKFWRPIVEAIVAALIDAKRQVVASGNPHAGLVFVLWGGHAQKLKTMVNKINLSKVGPPIDIVFIDAPHPAANGTTFHTVKTFTAIDEALAKLGLPAVDWLPKSSGGAASTSTPAKIAKASAAKAAATTSASSAAEPAAPKAKKTDSAKKAGKKASTAKKAAPRKKKAESEDEESFASEDSLDEDDEEESKKRKEPSKRTAPKRKAAAKKFDFGPDSDEEDDSDSQDDYKPSTKKAKR